MIDPEPSLRYGSYSASLEEYVEAVVFRHFLQGGQPAVLPKKAIPDVTNEEYLGGVFDFVGELNRYCITRATVRDVDEVRRCRDLCERIFESALQLDLRNGSLRKKMDGLKYALNKMETVLYELSYTNEGSVVAGMVKANREGAPQPEENGGED